MERDIYPIAIKQLEKLLLIYESIGVKAKDITEIKKVLSALERSMEGLGQTSQKEKIKVATISECIIMLKDKQYNKIKGIKVNYEKMNSSESVIKFITDNTKTKVLKETTTIDLKLLYYILTGETSQFKRTKDEMYETIKMFIRAKKRGEAFLQY